MMLLTALLLAAAQTTTPAPSATSATSLPAPPPATAPKPALVRVLLTTEAGPITLALEKDRAPVTTANFLRYVDGRKLDGVTFYRAVKVGEGYGLVQFGTRNDPKRTFPGITHETTTTTGLSHVDGALSMAMAKPGTAAGDFFVVVGDITSMDAHDADPGFAVFGRVAEGMDVVRSILLAPTSPTLGDGVMKGQMLAPGIKVLSARRIP